MIRMKFGRSERQRSPEAECRIVGELWLLPLRSEGRKRKEKGASAKIWDKKGRHRLTYMGHISGFGMSEKYIKCVYSIQLKSEE